ncbi:MAG: hypothetical protein ACNYVW_06080 [Methanosarcinales archaeon]
MLSCSKEFEYLKDKRVILREATKKGRVVYETGSSEEIFFTHSISELIQLAEELDAEFEDVKRASKLDQYYNPTRFPNSLSGDVPSRV